MFKKKKKCYPTWRIADQVNEQCWQLCPPDLLACCTGDSHEALSTGLSHSPHVISAQLEKPGQLQTESDRSYLPFSILNVGYSLKVENVFNKSTQKILMNYIQLTIHSRNAKAPTNKLTFPKSSHLSPSGKFYTYEFVHGAHTA